VSRVSVVIPSFNRPGATRAAVLSALAQTLPPLEVLVVDDASEPALDAAALQALDPRVRVVRLDVNRGAAGARQAGVDRARGDAIAFLDSDDRWLPEKLAGQVPLLADDLCAVACGWAEVDVSGVPRGVRRPLAAAGVAAFASGCWFSPGTTVILRRAALDRVGPLDAGLGRLEDLDWFIRFARLGGRLAVAPVIGAVIVQGSRARLAPVRAAADRILAKAAGEYGLDAGEARLLRAWLDVECARAAHNERRWAAFALHLARSYMRVPRQRIQLRDWWIREAWSTARFAEPA